MGENIPFNKLYSTGTEMQYIQQAIANGKLSSVGYFTRRCQHLVEKKYNFKNVLFTNSATDALEMSALLIDIQPNDEVIIPSYTFVSTANAFILRGAKIVFADSEAITPNIDTTKIEALITPRTKAIVCVHYNGVGCNMIELSALAKKYNLYIIEDAAQAINGWFEGSPLGSWGHIATFSFHDTKNISCGEGGMLIVNDSSLFERAIVIHEKGTNRSAFLSGIINKYEWIDIGSSYAPSELNTAYLLAQLEQIDQIQVQRNKLWNTYYTLLKPLQDLGFITIPPDPKLKPNNAHCFYFVCQSQQLRDDLIDILKTQKIETHFHYQSLHNSTYFHKKHDGRILGNSDRYSSSLLRLPLFFELTTKEVTFICNTIKFHFENTLTY